MTTAEKNRIKWQIRYFIDICINSFHFDLHANQPVFDYYSLCFVSCIPKIISCILFQLRRAFTVNNQIRMKKCMTKSRQITHVNVPNGINKWQICGQNFFIIFLLTHQKRDLKRSKDMHYAWTAMCVCEQCAWFGWMWLRICTTNLHTTPHRTHVFVQLNVKMKSLTLNYKIIKWFYIHCAFGIRAPIPLYVYVQLFYAAKIKLSRAISGDVRWKTWKSR